MYTGYPDIDAALDELADGIDDLVEIYGEELIRELVVQYVPSMVEAMMNEGTSPLNPLNWFKGAKKGAKKAPKKGKKGTKGKKRRDGVGGSVVDGLTDGVDAIGAGAMSLFGKNIDQDVNIAAQEIDVKVTNPTLEDLVATTNKLLLSLTDTLTGGIGGLDLSIDNLIAAETGESLAAVQGRQATGAGEDTPPEIEPAPVNEPEKDERILPKRRAPTRRK